MHDLLKKAGDQDYEFLCEAEDGLLFGVLHGLPRTRASFERQVKWALDDDPSQVPLMEKKNYPSAEERRDHLRSHLDAEVEEGLVQRMSRKEFEMEFGENRAISALAVLVEDEALGKKRVIHDGSHDVRVNHRIRPLDKIRMPGAREKRFILQQLREKRRVGRPTGDSSTGGRSKASWAAWFRRMTRGFMSTRSALLASPQLRIGGRGSVVHFCGWSTMWWKPVSSSTFSYMPMIWRALLWERMGGLPWW